MLLKHIKYECSKVKHKHKQNKEMINCSYYEGVTIMDV